VLALGFLSNSSTGPSPEFTRSGVEGLSNSVVDLQAPCPQLARIALPCPIAPPESCASVAYCGRREARSGGGTPSVTKMTKITMIKGQAQCSWCGRPQIYPVGISYHWLPVFSRIGRNPTGPLQNSLVGMHDQSPSDTHVSHRQSAA
jgi:hypothetical protein